MFTKRTDLALEARELWQESAAKTTRLPGVKAVSYTHLDVYKRQPRRSRPPIII